MPENKKRGRGVPSVPRTGESPEVRIPLTEANRPVKRDHNDANHGAGPGDPAKIAEANRLRNKKPK